MPDYARLDATWARLAAMSPDLRNGMTSHAPMVVEALCALGRGDAIEGWLPRYAPEFLPHGSAALTIGHDTWRDWLGHFDQTPAWGQFFDAELAEAPWRTVLRHWVGPLAPGLCASALHGIIRVGHAARALVDDDTAVRRHELACGLAYWAANYQTLPTAGSATGRAMSAREAIAHVEPMPAAARGFGGTIVSGLVGLNDHASFPSVIDLFDTAGDPSTLLSDLSETFAGVYLANAHDVLGAVVFTHGVTSIAALRSVLPLLDELTTRRVLRFAWQAGVALFAAFGAEHPSWSIPTTPSIDEHTLVARAIANGDEHAIKLTEACLREYGVRPTATYLAVAQHGIERLGVV